MHISLRWIQLKRLLFVVCGLFWFNQMRVKVEEAG